MQEVFLTVFINAIIEVFMTIALHQLDQEIFMQILMTGYIYYKIDTDNMK